MFVVSMVSRANGSFEIRSLSTSAAPLYIAAPNTDSLFMPEQRARTVEILSQNKQQFNMHIDSGVSHGFAVSLTPYSVKFFYANFNHRRVVILMTRMQNGRRKELSKASLSGSTSGCEERLSSVSRSRGHAWVRPPVKRATRRAIMVSMTRQPFTRRREEYLSSAAGMANYASTTISNSGSWMVIVRVSVVVLLRQLSKVSNGQAEAEVASHVPTPMYDADVGSNGSSRPGQAGIRTIFDPPNGSCLDFV